MLRMIPQRIARQTTKIPPDTARLLRLISAFTGEKQYAVLERLVRIEYDRVRRADERCPQHKP